MLEKFALKTFASSRDIAFSTLHLHAKRVLRMKMLRLIVLW